MSEQGDKLDLGTEPPEKRPPWGIILCVSIFIALVVLVFVVSQHKKADQARQAVLDVLDKELTGDEDAMKAQRDKVMDLTKQVEILRAQIQSGDVKSGKAAVAQFNQLAAQQRTEREKFAKMASDYNQKVAKFHELQQ